MNIRQTEKKDLEKYCNNYKYFEKLPYFIKKIIIDRIENSIYNAAVDKTREKNLKVNWKSDVFIEHYSNIGYHIKINLDINSHINNNKDEKIKTYLISRIYNVAIYIILKQIQIKKKIQNNIFKLIMSYFPVININKIGYMNSIVLNPLINKDYINELELRGKQEIQIKFSTFYKCSQCGNRKTQQQEIQTRSGDEGYTLFITCLVCSYRWQIYT